MAVSAGEFMFEETRNYVKQRKAFGKTVAHIQVSLLLGIIIRWYPCIRLNWDWVKHKFVIIFTESGFGNHGYDCENSKDKSVEE